MDKCFSPNCDSKAELYCRCLKPYFKFCRTHITDHLMLDTGIHKTKAIRQNKKQVEDINLKVKKFCDSLSALEEEILNEKTKTLDLISSKYDDLIKEISNRKIELLAQQENIFNKDPSNYLSSLRKLSRNKLKGRLDKWEVPNKISYYSKVKNIIKSDMLFNEPLPPIYAEKTNFLFFFSENNFSCIKKLNFAEENFNIEVKKMNGIIFPINCQITDDLVFIGGTFKNLQYNNYYLYDVRTFSGVELKPLENDYRYFCASVYACGEVYLFGGCRNPNFEYLRIPHFFEIENLWIDSIAKYEISSNKWVLLSSSLPVPSEVSACIANNKVYLSGYKLTKLYIFYLNELRMKETNIDVECNKLKILLSYKNKKFLICNSQIFKISNSKKKTLKSYTQYFEDVYITQHVYRKGFIYLTDNRSVWVLNIKTVELKELTLPQSHLRFDPCDEGLEFSLMQKRKRNN